MIGNAGSRPSLRSLVLPLVAAVALLTPLATPAEAVSVSLSGTTAYALSDVDVDGTLYDVSFMSITPGDYTASELAAYVFAVASATALDAVEAINTALDGTVATTVALDSVGTDATDKYYLFYDLSGGSLSEKTGAYSTSAPSANTWDHVTSGTGPASSTTARFTAILSQSGVSALPVPAALPLLGSGLFALGLIGRRRKRAAIG